jgi:hypothetical protein
MLICTQEHVSLVHSMGPGADRPQRETISPASLA